MFKVIWNEIKTREIVLTIIFYSVILGISFFRPLTIKIIMDEGLIAKSFQTVLFFSIILLLLGVVEGRFTILQEKIYVNIQNKIERKLFVEAFQKLLNVKSSYYLYNNTSEIIHRLTTDIGNVGLIINSGLIGILGQVLQIMSGVLGLCIISWKLALLVVVSIPVKYFLTCFFSDKEEKTVRLWLDKLTDFTAWLDDTIHGIREIKLWNLHKYKESDLKKRQEEVLLLKKRNRLWEVYNQVSDNLLQWTIIAALYGTGGYLVCRDSLTLGTLTAFLSYSNYVISPISMVFNMRLIYAQMKPSIVRLNAFFDEETENNSGCRIEKKQFQEYITFKDVQFSYNENSLLKNVNIQIEKNEKIAIIGENGSGKSTIINLLLRFIKPQSGTIYLDGINIQDIDLNEYRNLFAVVSQDIYLFNDTLRNNLMMGKFIEREEFNNKVNMMEMQNFFEKLPKSYDSEVENNGDNFSGGEKQKIALLRAIIKDAPILILDEATANIDREYDLFVHQNILNKFFDKTIIIITHKKDNLKGVDKILQIKDETIYEVPKESD